MLTLPGLSRLQNRKAFAVICFGLVSAASILLYPAGTGAQSRETELLPEGVRVETVLEGMDGPVAMVFDPQGRLFYTEKTGAVRLFADGVLQPEPVITFRVNSNDDRGLSGIALDPSFETNRYIYVTYTCDDTSEDCPDPQNRVVRFVERDGSGSDPTTLF